MLYLLDVEWWKDAYVFGEESCAAKYKPLGRTKKFVLSVNVLLFITAVAFRVREPFGVVWCGVVVPWCVVWYGVVKREVVR